MSAAVGMKLAIRILTMVLLFAPGSAVAAQAVCSATERVKLSASDAASTDFFGDAVALDGDVAVMGARSTFIGSAYVFERSPLRNGGWPQIATLVAGDDGERDLFGRSVAVSGGTAIVGDPDFFGSIGPPGKAGTAFIFDRDATGPHRWGQVARLTAGELEDRFGAAVDISGDTAIVGAFAADEFPGPFPGPAFGAAYVFERSAGPLGWGAVAKLTGSGDGCCLEFGESVAIDGDVALVGSSRDFHAGNSSGAVYVFERNAAGPNAWGPVAKLTASDAAPLQGFGSAVALSGDIAVVSAGFHEAAYVFRRNARVAGGWAQVAKLTADDASPSESFGSSVAVEGHVVVVGASRAGVSGSSTGAAYVFAGAVDGGDESWRRIAKLAATDAAAEDELGRAVGVSGAHVIAGAPFDDDGGFNSGSAYVFGAIADCNENGVPDACDVTQGTSADQDRNGTPDECECLTDLDGDGILSRVDRFLLVLGVLSHFGPCPESCPLDLDLDRDVDSTDLLLVIHRTARYSYGPQCSGVAAHPRDR